jgi:hypothetical protein
VEIGQHFVCFGFADEREVDVCSVEIFGLRFVAGEGFGLVGSLGSESDSLSAANDIFEADWFDGAGEGFGGPFAFGEHCLLIIIAMS